MPQRLVACQGPIQLVTAVAVLRQRDRDGANKQAWSDHLAILELAVPPAQETALVDALEGMARTLRPWRSIVHVTDAKLQRLERGAAGLPGLDDVRELYLVREWQRANEVLLGVFSDARKICFGDSIGIYLAPSYIAPAARFGQGVMQRLRRAFRGRRSADLYYLALPRAFDRPPSRNVAPTDLALLRQTLADLQRLLPRQIVDEVRRRAAGGALTLLVGSNFSEQGAMSMEAEIAAYVAYLAENSPARRSLLVLKPHPRDRHEKTAAVQAALRGLFDDVLTLSDEAGLYLPLEALLLELQSGELHSGEPPPAEVVLCTFSSACLASRHLLGLSPRIGFGERLVRRYFHKPYVEPRLRHEAQLLRACA